MKATYFVFTVTDAHELARVTTWLAGRPLVMPQLVQDKKVYAIVQGAVDTRWPDVAQVVATDIELGEMYITNSSEGDRRLTQAFGGKVPERLPHTTTLTFLRGAAVWSVDIPAGARLAPARDLPDYAKKPKLRVCPNPYNPETAAQATPEMVARVTELAEEGVLLFEATDIVA